VQSEDEPVWCEYELRRFPSEQFDFTLESGLVHTRPPSDAPAHSTNGAELSDTVWMRTRPTAPESHRSEDGWLTPLIEPVDGR
jgi:hypothetical protein